jgi:hypothetical protein
MAKGWKSISVRDDIYLQLKERFAQSKNPYRIEFSKWVNNLLADYLEQGQKLPTTTILTTTNATNTTTPTTNRLPIPEIRKSPMSEEWW